MINTPLYHRDIFGKKICNEPVLIDVVAPLSLFDEFISSLSVFWWRVQNSFQINLYLSIIDFYFFRARKRFFWNFATKNLREILVK